MIVIFFALSREIVSIKSKVNILGKIRFGHITFYHAELYGFPVALIQTGIGQNVSSVLQHLSQQFRIQLVISSGFAGALRPEIDVGDLVIGEKVLYVTDETLGKKAHSSPVISCESSILDVARELSGSPRFKVHYGIIATTNKIIHLSSYKKLLGNTTYAIAVDMESFLIAEQSHNLGIPFIVVRAISDRADEDVAVCENLVNEKGNINVPAVSLYLFKKPYSIFTLKNLRKQAKFASRSLSEFLPDFITQIYNTLLK
ncbi:5'-methylthioadenosine nucleosidase [Candidatus Kuenenia stuttgartiensis]|jgi:adenosylhomocysteine nucleosidase|uniref:5'-methylthioadenosine nucleosidase n=1 Tax=Kuenenia stuttgartiensis TaxID=174633 RepID=Q1Q1K1_KUEST|nr:MULTISPECIES: hypothetical protein [Kuenenia]MBE7548593.1 hypothetical protein [Planctomycetia bacterium]MBZ0191746.1 hypothetical protein [Candidatus Kuenenia stuttgartiensis]MCF6152249.1 hypothetical protein [Candidatus Kuenenia stuttgartiensis]MCL4726695.1 hypothetical protein [Candidatus Kuenenia stuttgartiensis]MCZ7621504.1 hypothetical protein [Candidatus Kuenenia sp.]